MCNVADVVLEQINHASDIVVFKFSPSLSVQGIYQRSIGFLAAVF